MTGEWDTDVLRDLLAAPGSGAPGGAAAPSVAPDAPDAPEASGWRDVVGDVINATADVVTGRYGVAALSAEERDALARTTAAVLDRHAPVAAAGIAHPWLAWVCAVAAVGIPRAVARASARDEAAPGPTTEAQTADGAGIFSPHRDGREGSGEDAATGAMGPYCPPSRPGARPDGVSR